MTASRGGFGAVLALVVIACSSGSGGGGFLDGGAGTSAGGTGGGVGGTGGAGGGFGGGAGGPGGSGGTAGAACEAPTVNTLSGTFFLAASAVLSPSKPIVFRATLAWPNSSLEMRLQPLAASDRKTPVGTEIALAPIPVSPDGTLQTSTYGVQVPGEANPITGSDLEMSVGFSGKMCGNQDFYCGDLHGQVTVPITLDLAGSTFTLQRVSSDPATYPEPPYIDCNNTLAEPLASP